jgi:hypothetical protein
MTLFVERIPNLETHNLAVEEEADPMFYIGKQFQLKNPVYKYTVELETEQNGRVNAGPLYLRPEDRIAVFVKMTPHDLPASSVYDEYKHMIRDSALHELPDDDAEILYRRGLGFKP